MDPGGSSAEVRLERRRVHRHQHVGRVARRDDVVVGDVDLERRHPGDRAGRRPDLGRVVRHRGQVVAEDRAHVGEAVAGELHAVAGVAGEADDDLVEARARAMWSRVSRSHHLIVWVGGARGGGGRPGGRGRGGREAPASTEWLERRQCARTAASTRRRSRARPMDSASTSTRLPTPPARWKKRRRSRPTTMTGSPGARVSTQGGGSQTVTGTEVALPSPPGQRSASVARRVPDSSSRTSGAAEQGPHTTQEVDRGVALDRQCFHHVPFEASNDGEA